MQLIVRVDSARLDGFAAVKINSITPHIWSWSSLAKADGVCRVVWSAGTTYCHHSANANYYILFGVQLSVADVNAEELCTERMEMRFCCRHRCRRSS